MELLLLRSIQRNLVANTGAFRLLFSRTWQSCVLLTNRLMILILALMHDNKGGGMFGCT